MKILQKTIKWLIETNGVIAEIETADDDKEMVSVKPLSRPAGLYFLLDGGFCMYADNSLTREII